MRKKKKKNFGFVIVNVKILEEDLSKKTVTKKRTLKDSNHEKKKKLFSIHIRETDFSSLRISER